MESCTCCLTISKQRPKSSISSTCVKKRSCQSSKSSFLELLNTSSCVFMSMCSLLIRISKRSCRPILMNSFRKCIRKSRLSSGTKLMIALMSERQLSLKGSLPCMPSPIMMGVNLSCFLSSPTIVMASKTSLCPSSPSCCQIGRQKLQRSRKTSSMILGLEGLRDCARRVKPSACLKNSLMPTMLLQITLRHLMASYCTLSH